MAVVIGGITVGPGHPVYVIAEIGLNHNGDVEIAKQLIDVAADSGAQAVKFQKRTPAISTPEHMKNTPRETPWGTMTYLDYRYRVEFSREQYIEIGDYATVRGLDWFASPWDVPSVDFLENLNVVAHKVASASVTDVEMLEALAATGKPIIMSTGMATVAEIGEAVAAPDEQSTTARQQPCDEPFARADRRRFLRRRQVRHPLDRPRPLSFVRRSGHREQHVDRPQPSGEAGRTDGGTQSHTLALRRAEIVRRELGVRSSGQRQCPLDRRRIFEHPLHLTDEFVPIVDIVEPSDRHGALAAREAGSHSTDRIQRRCCDHEAIRRHHSEALIGRGVTANMGETTVEYPHQRHWAGVDGHVDEAGALDEFLHPSDLAVVPRHADEPPSRTVVDQHAR